MMENVTSGVLSEAKKARRDLMPLIVVLVCTIVFAIVIVTLHNLLAPEKKESNTSRQSVLIAPDDDLFAYIIAGNEAMEQQEYTVAESNYLQARALCLETKKVSPMIRFELALRLADTEVELKKYSEAEKYLQEADQYRQEVIRVLAWMTESSDKHLMKSRENGGK